MQGYRSTAMGCNSSQKFLMTITPTKLFYHTEIYSIEAFGWDSVTGKSFLLLCFLVILWKLKWDIFISNKSGSTVKPAVKQYSKIESEFRVNYTVQLW